MLCRILTAIKKPEVRLLCLVRNLTSPIRQLIVNLRTEFRIRKKAYLARKGMVKVRAKAARGENLQVVFIVTEPSKWKCQSVYDAMEKSEMFEPEIGVTVPDLHFKKPLADLKEDFDRCYNYFANQGMRVRKIFDMRKGFSINLTKGSVDILFYPSAAFCVKGQMPCDVASFAISCYVPYFVPNYCNLDADCGMPNHRMFDFHFVLNESLAKAYKEFQKKFYDSQFVPVGHPALDAITFDSQCGDGKHCVVYAPHWTIDTPATFSPFRYSTFEWSGLAILEYAKKHQELQWVFKPHPNLWRILVDGGVMSEQDRNKYYDDWRKIGKVADSGGYADIFNDSSAMITDCGSFLTEYAVTGKPIIHLISKANRECPAGALANLYSTYYRVVDKRSLNSTLKNILEDRIDPNRIARLNALKQINVNSAGAANNIVEALEKAIKDKRDESCPYKL